MKSPVSRTSPSDRVLEEASGWFVNFRVGDADTAEQAEFDRWLRRSPENIQAYLEIAETWADLPAAKPSIDVPACVFRLNVIKDSTRMESVIPAIPKIADVGWLRSMSRERLGDDFEGGPGKKSVFRQWNQATNPPWQEPWSA